MRTVEYKEYIIELPGGAELRLNEEAWNAVQYLIKQAKREALLEAAQEEENEAVRMFLMYYGANGGITVNAMRENLFLAGFDGYWPGWVEEAENLEHLTKAGAQSWLRHLFFATTPSRMAKELET